LTDSERLFDSLLEEVATGRRSKAECIAQCELRHPELAPSLRLAFDLGCVGLEPAEVDAARARVWTTVESTLNQDDAPPPTVVSARSACLAGLATWRTSPWFAVAVCAAIVALIFSGSWALTAASTDALPSSPLYGVKRTEENLQLQLAWSNQMRGEALAQIAMHRLKEAHDEAARHNTNQALTLMSESNAATHQLIALVIEIHQQRQDDTAVRNTLVSTLQAEYDALQQARNDGQSALAQALASNVTDQQDVLRASSILVPPMATPVPTTPTVTAPPTTTPEATEAPASPPAPKPTPSATSNSNNSGSGNNNDSGNSHGKGNGHSSAGSGD
jgi:uncharacterized protein DUF5667